MTSLVLTLLGFATGGEVVDSGIVRVSIPSRNCNPRDHGAVANGVTDDTLPIQAALDECGTAGGGTVILACKPSQKECVFASFPLVITGNHTEFRVDDAATLRFSSARNDTRWHGVWAALSGTPGLHDIAITGGGTIDGNG